MKSFFENLFGRKQESSKNQKPAEPVRQNRGQREEPEIYKKGDVIAGKYEVLGTLGKGGFGIVFLVHERNTGEARIALKTFRDELLADATAREAFKKEALLWVNLERHPYILAAEWVEEVFGRLFVAMQYVEPDSRGCVSLAHHLARASGPLDANRAIEWAIQFCLGMEHAKAQGIECHRDIKPDNILVTRNGTLKVSDFGLAKAAEAAWVAAGRKGGSPVWRRDGENIGFSLVESEGKVRCGTPGYMPPEVYRGEGADARSDIYSFGLVLWQMATGSRVPPFLVTYRGDMGEYLQEIYQQQMTSRVPFPKGPLGLVIDRCLQPIPSKRYSSFEELRRVLEALWEQRIGAKFEPACLSEQTVMTLNNKGTALDALGRYDEAIECFDRVLAIEPQNAKVWVNKGGALDALGQHKDAIECFDKALAIEPREASAWNNKGNALRVIGRSEEAVHCYDKALAIDPGNADVWDNKGNELYALSRYKEAIRCYDEALATDSKRGQTWFNRGNVLRALGQHKKAVGCYDKALALDPLSAPTWNNKGNALDDLDQHDEAVRCFDKALGINPRYTPAWTNKGNTLDNLGRHEEAITCFDGAIAIEPSFTPAWYNKGSALFALHRYEEGIQCCDKVLATEPENTNAWYNKGTALRATGRYENAIECYDKVVLIESQNAKAWIGKATALDAIGRSGEATSSYRKFLQTASPDDVKLIEFARRRLQELAGDQ